MFVRSAECYMQSSREGGGTGGRVVVEETQRERVNKESKKRGRVAVEETKCQTTEIKDTRTYVYTCIYQRILELNWSLFRKHARRQK